MSSRGIFGVKKDPKKPCLFMINGGEEWPSDDSSDSDFNPRKKGDVSDTDSDSSPIKKKADSPSKRSETSEYGSVAEGGDSDYFTQTEAENGSGVLNSPEAILEEEVDSGREAGGSDWEENKDQVQYRSQISRHNKLLLRIKRSNTNDQSTKQSDDSSDPWGTTLPPEILIRIFGTALATEEPILFLLNVGSVCCTWRAASYMPTVPIDLDLSKVRSKHRNEDTLTYLCSKRFERIKSLKLSGWNKVLTESVFEDLPNLCPELESLGMSGISKLSSENLKHIVTNCSSLKKVDLSAMLGDKIPSNNALRLISLTEMAKTMNSRLTHLNIAHNNIVNNLKPVMSALAQHCSSLEVLDLTAVTGMRDILFPIEELQWGCPKLRLLRLNNSVIQPVAVPLKKQAMAPGFPCLEELSCGISGMYRGLSDEDLERLLKASSRLTLLDIRGCCTVTGKHLLRLPAWNLQHLYMAGIAMTKQENSNLELIMRKWGGTLVDLNLAWATNTDSLDAALVALAEASENSKLRSLDLQGSSVNLKAVLEVLKCCAHLRSLNLSSCRALPRGIKRDHNGKDLRMLKKRLQNRSILDDAE